MIGIGVGIDYSLFIVTRFRQYLHEGLPPCDAAAEAGASAGRAVIFAGLTVAISVTGLAFFGLDFVTKLGIGGGARRPHDGADRELAAHCRAGEARAQGRPPESAVPEADRRLRGRAPEHAHRTLGSVRNRPREAGVLDPARDRPRCSPGPRRSCGSARRIRARSRRNQTARRAYDLLAEGFGPGFNGPIPIVVDVKGDTGSPAAGLRRCPGARRAGDVASVGEAAVQRREDRRDRVRHPGLGAPGRGDGEARPPPAGRRRAEGDRRRSTRRSTSPA